MWAIFAYLAKPVIRYTALEKKRCICYVFTEIPHLSIKSKHLHDCVILVGRRNLMLRSEQFVSSFSKSLLKYTRNKYFLIF